jgi:hypothetical protein
MVQIAKPTVSQIVKKRSIHIGERRAEGAVRDHNESASGRSMDPKMVQIIV